MKKYIALPILALTLILTACAPATTMPQYAPTSVEETPPPQATAVTNDPTVQPVSAVAGPVCYTYDPKISDTEWIKGNGNAPITLMVYSDFQCPYCAQADPILNQVLEKYPNDVRLVFRHFPLPIHPLAKIAAQAAEAAGKQGIFFEYSEALFASQADWSDLDEASAQQYYIQLAQSMELDPTQFAADMVSPEIVQRVTDAENLGNTEQVSHTPYILVNGTLVSSFDLNSISALVDESLSIPAALQNCPTTQLSADKQYSATIQTSYGDITFDLNSAHAPETVNTFVYLANNGRYAKEIMNVGKMAETSETNEYMMIGDLSRPTVIFLNPEVSDSNFDQAGVVGILPSNQIFITMVPLSNLNGYYTVLGQITKGLDIVQSITTNGESITNIIITEK